MGVRWTSQPGAGARFLCSVGKNARDLRTAVTMPTFHDPL